MFLLVLFFAAQRAVLIAHQTRERPTFAVVGRNGVFAYGAYVYFLKNGVFWAGVAYLLSIHRAGRLCLLNRLKPAT